MTTDLLDLCEDYLSGTATARDVATLDQRLQTDAESRRLLLRLSLLHGQLARAAKTRRRITDDILSPAALRQHGPARGVRMPAAAWLIAAFVAAAAATVIVAVFRMEHMADRVARTASQQTTPLGIYRAVRHAVPTDAAKPIQPGMEVVVGRLAIAGGAIDIELINGVSIILQGPGELELIDPMRAFLHAGSAVVRVPKGMSGFLLGTAATEVFDLGTEFAVRTGEGGFTDVQVYDGAVVTTPCSATGTGKFPRRLEAGQARRFQQGSPDGRPLPYEESRFVRFLPTETAVGHPQWTEASEETRRFGRPRIEAIRVTRAADRPVIDGRLDEWPTGGAFRASLNGTANDEEWVEGRMAYDEQCLYIAARVGDPAPMRSKIDPEIDAPMAWQGGAVQVRLSTDREMGWPADANGPSYYRIRGLEPMPEERQKAANPKLSHLLMWYNAASGRACLAINHGMGFGEPATNPAGFEGCFRKGADGRYYTLEYAIPWSLLNAGDSPPRSGDILATHWQVHWSDETGLIWRDQVVEIRNPHELRRLVSFERAATWGRAEYE